MSDVAMNKMSEVMRDLYGNPSSLHTYGQLANEAIEAARETIASHLGCSAKEIYFTSGGSESDNQAIISAALYGKKRGKTHLITTKIEHHAVLHTMERLEKDGFEVTYLDVGNDGIVKVDDVRDAIRDTTALVSVMYANNEIGTIQPIAEIGKLCAEKKVLFHTDAVQAAGHIKIDVNELGVDYLSLSAHKFHGPKGIGALYARRRSLLTPLIDGGAQEKNKRAGTENVPAIVSMAAALDESVRTIDEVNPSLLKMRDRLINGLLEIPHSVLNGDAEKRLAGNVNVCFEGIEGESLLLMLDMKGIMASSGSACTSGSLDPSHVLLAIGRPHEIAHGSLRLSLSDETTEEDIDYAIDAVTEVVTFLRGMSPVWRDLESGKQEFVIK